MIRTLGRGVAFPVGVDERGRMAMVSDVHDVEQAIRLIMDTAPGERPMRPEFGCGVHDLVFDGIDADTTRRIEDAVRAALERWEPRIEVEAVTFDTTDAAVLLISIAYRIKNTNDQRNLVYPLYVIPTEEGR